MDEPKPQTETSKLEFVFKWPALEQRAAIHTVIGLWHQKDVRELLEKSCIPFNRFREEKWQEIVEKVKRNARMLALPQFLEITLLSKIYPIGLQILDWIEYHQILCSTDTLLSDKFLWTPQGTVDKKKTAQVLIKQQTLDIIGRYKLACIYCLEDDIPVLWEQIPKEKRSFYVNADQRNPDKQSLVAYWSYKVQGKLNLFQSVINQIQQDLTPHEFIFQCACLGRYETAAKYFLAQLNADEKANILSSCAIATAFDENRKTDILCFLLSAMGKGQQQEVFETCCARVLRHLLVWPWQEFFLRTAEYAEPHISPDGFAVTLSVIGDKMRGTAPKDYNYRKLFAQFWDRSPAGHRNCAIQHGINLIFDLFKSGDEENVRLIFKDASAEDKKRIYKVEGKEICAMLMCSNRWDLLKFFLEECLWSEEGMFELKNGFNHFSTDEELEMRNRFFQLLDTFIDRIGSVDQSQGM